MWTRWPWISLLFAIIVILSPLARDVFHDAFFSGEALARNISQAMLTFGFAFLILAVALEWLVRFLISRRRARGAKTV
jgi:hypothetical protein